MIKRTLYFGNPAYLSVRLEQLEIRFPEVQRCANLLESIKEESVRRIPIEDIGVVVFVRHELFSCLLIRNFYTFK